MYVKFRWNSNNSFWVIKIFLFLESVLFWSVKYTSVRKNIGNHVYFASRSITYLKMYKSCFEQKNRTNLHFRLHYKPNSLYSLLWDIPLMAPVIARAALYCSTCNCDGTCNCEGSIALNSFNFLSETFIIWFVIDYITIMQMRSDRWFIHL